MEFKKITTKEHVAMVKYAHGIADKMQLKGASLKEQKYVVGYLCAIIRRVLKSDGRVTMYEIETTISSSLGKTHTLPPNRCAGMAGVADLILSTATDFAPEATEEDFIASLMTVEDLRERLDIYRVGLSRYDNTEFSATLVSEKQELVIASKFLSSASWKSLTLIERATATMPDNFSSLDFYKKGK